MQSWVDGRKLQHVAPTEETRLAITKLLQRRHAQITFVRNAPFEHMLMICRLLPISVLRP